MYMYSEASALHDASSEHSRQGCLGGHFQDWGTPEVPAKKPKNQEPVGKVRLNLQCPVVAQVSQCLGWQAGHDLKGLFQRKPCLELFLRAMQNPHIYISREWGGRRVRCEETGLVAVTAVKPGKGRMED